MFKAGDQTCSPTEQRSSLATLRTASRKPDGMKPFVFAVGKTKTKIISLIGINGGKAHFKMVAKQMTLKSWENHLQFSSVPIKATLSDKKFPCQKKIGYEQLLLKRNEMTQIERLPQAKYCLHGRCILSSAPYSICQNSNIKSKSWSNSAETASPSEAFLVRITFPTVPAILSNEWYCMAA